MSIGPQKQPSSVSQINAQVKQSKIQLLEQRNAELEEQLAKAQTAVAVVERLKANATLVYDLLACRYEGLRDSEKSYGISDEDRSEMMTCLELTKLLEPWNEGPTLEAAVLGDGMEGER